METRVAVMSIIVEDLDSVEPLNTILHENGKYIIGRMVLRGSTESGFSTIILITATLVSIVSS